VLLAGAEGFTAGAEAGSLGAVAIGASAGAIGEGGAVIAGSVGIAGAGAAAVAEGAETASAAKSATRSGAKSAGITAEGAASSGASKGGGRAETAAPNSGASPSCNHSFLPTTKVLMADGHEKPIKDIKQGEKVRATDPKTGKSQSRTVEKLITTKHDKDFATITVVDGGKSSKIVATVTHPLWVESKRSWVDDAGDLKPGMKLHAASGLAAAISVVKNSHREHVTHDLTVSVTHTYYVLAGGIPILVHNCNGGTAPNGAACSCNGSTNPSNADLV
jgi:hypothetical protein